MKKRQHPSRQGVYKFFIQQNYIGYYLNFPHSNTSSLVKGQKNKSSALNDEKSNFRGMNQFINLKVESIFSKYVDDVNPF